MFIDFTVIFESPVIQQIFFFRLLRRYAKKKYQGHNDRVKVRFFWIITHLLISVGKKRDVESKGCTPMSFYRAIERYETAKNAPLYIFFRYQFITSSGRIRKKKGKKNYIVDHIEAQNRLMTLFIWKKKRNCSSNLL